MSLAHPTVYLAGPISGLGYAGATGWRDCAAKLLGARGIKALSPMRGKECLADVTRFTADGDAYRHLSPLATNRGIMTRDRWDATRCDVLLVNVKGATSVSIGTVMEIAWADSRRTPIVMITEPGNVHDHGMINEAVGYKVETLEDAVTVIAALIGVES